MAILSEIIQAIFRPAVAALAISLALATMTVESSQYRVKGDTISLSQLGCGGLLKPVCDFVSVF